MKLRPAHIVLAAFSLLILSLIVLADSGHGHRLFSLASRVPGGDKLGHLALFGLLSFMVNLIAGAVTTKLFGQQVLKGTAALWGLTALEECSQLFFESRSFDLLDLGAGALGIWLFGRVAAGYLNWKSDRKPAAAQVSREA